MLRSYRPLLACLFTVVGLLMSGCGSDGNDESTAVVPASPAMALFAGNVNTSYGSTDGTGTAARFGSPGYVAVDSTGTSYVADTENHTVRMITSAGVVTTLAGTAGQSGYVNGTGAAARFNAPRGIATDDVYVYVADSENNVIRRVAISSGAVDTFAGSLPVVLGSTSGTSDGVGTAARFDFPNGLASDGLGNLYVADTGNNSIRQIVIATADVSTLSVIFSSPRGVAADVYGYVYVADTGDSTIRVIDLNTTGFPLSTLAGASNQSGYVNDTGTAARFAAPYGLATDGANVYVADTNNNAIRQIVIATAVVTTLAGDSAGASGYVDGTGTSARFDFPNGLATDGAGKVYVADSGNNTIRKIDINTQAVSTLAGSAGYGYVNATGASARFDALNGLATDSAGNVYVADTDNNAIRKITPAGVVTTFAGSATGLAGNTDGPGTTALFDGPWGVATDSSDNVYVADYNNDTIRKITPAGVVSTLLDNATGVAAVFAGPNDVAVDSAGNVYVAAYGNSTIGKITPGGVVSTLAGTGTAGYTNGAGASAQFNEPWGIAVDSAGNVYVTDYGNNAIRKIDTSGVVSTFAGSATGLSGSADGTGTGASFNAPVYVATDSAGNVYVTDSGNYTIRKITTGGVVTTLAGTAGQNGFTPGALPGVLSNPTGIRVFGTTLYFGSNNGVVSITNLP